jgi:hypothetical protein
MKKLTIFVPIILIMSLITVAQEKKKESLPSNIPADGIHQPMFHKGMITLKVKEGIDLTPQREAVTFNIPSLDFKAERYQVSLLAKRFIYNPDKLKKGMPDLSRIYRIEFPEEYSVLEVAEDFSGDPNIEYAEPIPVNYLFDIPNDSLYSQQYYLLQIFAEQAWEVHKGENGQEDVVIAIVDSGVDWDHEDLVNNVWQNLGEDADEDGKVLQITFPSGDWIFDPGDENGIDDDGNGYIDDFIGWNFYSGSNDPNPIPGTYKWTHGTQMAGYAAASTNNEKGIASLSWNLEFMPVQAGWDCYVFQAYNAIIYAAENGAGVISNSWGNYIFNSQANQEAVNYALELGSIIVAGTANDNKFEIIYPASYPGVVSVSALNHLDGKASYSNFGPHVKISAPGGDIGNDLLTTHVNDAYTSVGGTSCATPIVAALLGLVKSYHPDLTPDQVITQVLGTADNIDNINPGFENRLGSGRINAFRALTDTGVTLQPEISIDLYSLSFQDSDNDNELEPGDTASLDLILRNYNYGVGADIASFTLISAHPSIVLLNDTYSCSIPPDDYFTLDDAFPFIVGDTDSTFQAEFQLITTSEKEITWGDTLSIILLIAPQGLLVYQDEGEGDAYSGDFIYENLVALGYQSFYTPIFPPSLKGFDAVFLSIGNFGYDLRSGTPITYEMMQAMEEYLEQGGRIYVDCGTFFGAQTFHSYPDIEILKGLFGISETYHPMTYNYINLLTGINGSICENLSFTDSDQSPVWFIETMTPNEYGMAALEEEGYGTVAVQGAGEHGQRTFYMSYALGQLVDGSQGTREELLSRIVDWLLIGVGADESRVPGSGFRVEVWPNPAADHVVVSVSGQRSAVGGQVSLKIYDLYGREVRTLVDEAKSPGDYTVGMDVSDLPAGVYLVRLQAGGQSAVRKLIVR